MDTKLNSFFAGDPASFPGPGDFVITLDAPSSSPDRKLAQQVGQYTGLTRSESGRVHQRWICNHSYARNDPVSQFVVDPLVVAHLSDVAEPRTGGWSLRIAEPDVPIIVPAAKDALNQMFLAEDSSVSRLYGLAPMNFQADLTGAAVGSASL
ncbi:MAG: hypothetical protein GY953_29860, partial [bacterium]|nr:hypothetical protein [bacterium]